MKTILICTLLAAFSIGILPNADKTAIQKTPDLVLLVEPYQKPEQTAQEEKTADAAPESADSQTVRLLTDGGVQELSMEDYLTGVLLSEMPPEFEEEARKAQAVAARTFTFRKCQHPKHDEADVCDRADCCQAWTSREGLKEKYGNRFPAVWASAQKAVSQTAGEVLLYDGELIDAVYFSCSGGQTEAAVSVWGTDVPYLQSVASPGETDAPRDSSQAIFTPDEFLSRLRKENAAVQLDGAPETWLGQAQYSSGGGVLSYTLGGAAFSGAELRRIFSLNSTKFTLSYQDGAFVFDVSGFGHRVGLSQYGAEHMARLGFSYQTILQYYYQGAHVENSA